MKIVEHHPQCPLVLFITCIHSRVFCFRNTNALWYQTKTPTADKHALPARHLSFQVNHLPWGTAAQREDSAWTGRVQRTRDYRIDLLVLSGNRWDEEESVVPSIYSRFSGRAVVVLSINMYTIIIPAVRSSNTCQHRRTCGPSYLLVAPTIGDQVKESGLQRVDSDVRPEKSSCILTMKWGHNSLGLPFIGFHCFQDWPVAELTCTRKPLPWKLTREISIARHVSPGDLEWKVMDESGVDFSCLYSTVVVTWAAITFRRTVLLDSLMKSTKLTVMSSLHIMDIGSRDLTIAAYLLQLFKMIHQRELVSPAWPREKLQGLGQV